MAAATTSESTVRSRTRVTSRGGSGKRTCSARGRRTGGKPQSSKTLVLSLAASGSVDQGDQSSDEILAVLIAREDGQRESSHLTSREGKKCASVCIKLLADVFALVFLFLCFGGFVFCKYERLLFFSWLTLILGI